MAATPKAVWEGSFTLLDVEVKCYVLEDGQRIIDSESLERYLNADASDVKQTEVEFHRELNRFAKWKGGN